MRVIEVLRDDHRVTRVIDEPDDALGEDSIRLRIDRFSITSNNVSYAVYGDAIGYWNFFPITSAWGRVPSMGWAEITESNVEGLAVGSRHFGWYPMADVVDIEAVPTSDGFEDVGQHRAGHALIYRSFVDTSADPLYEGSEDGEDRQSLLRGLFLTSFLADEYLADPPSGEPYFGAEQVLVLSASAKTAIGFAQRAALRGRRIIGATSSRNRDFVSGLAWYDQVVTYDEIGELDNTKPIICVDVAGDEVLLAGVHQHFEDQLRHSMLIGLSHHDAPPLPEGESFRGIDPEFFAAPLEIERRRALWGDKAFDVKASAALASFVDGSRSWLGVDRLTDGAAACAAWEATFDGAASPSSGTVVSLN